MQFIVEPARVAYWFAVLVSSPQRRRCCFAISATDAGAFCGRLKKETAILKSFSL